MNTNDAKDNEFKDYTFGIQKGSFWNRALKIDTGKLASGLAETLLSGFLQDPIEYMKSSITVINSLKLKAKPEALAWQLVWTSLIQATFQLASRHFSGSHPLDESQLKALLESINQVVEDSDIALDESLFKAPEQAAFLQNVQAAIETWLNTYKNSSGSALNKQAAKAAFGGLRNRFAVCLDNVLRKDPKTYDDILEKCFSVAGSAAQRNLAWERYRRKLRLYPLKPLFGDPGESISLKDIYVPLYAYWIAVEETNDFTRQRDETEKKTGHRIDLTETIHDWRKGTANNRAHLKLITGGPGTGKSSFCRMLAAELAEKGDDVLFIPLHLFSIKSDLVGSVGDWLRQTELLVANPLDPTHEAGSQDLLLIFDGLDELEQQGSKDDVQDFIRFVHDGLDRLNQADGRTVRAIIAGRDAAIQASRDLKRCQDDDLYHLLNYKPDCEDLDQLCRRGADFQALVKQDQRGDWWDKYREARTHQSNEGLPRELARDELDDLTRYPLLNYLVALSWERGKIDFRQDITRSEVYEDMLRAVYEREWGDKQQKNPKLTLDLDYEDFARVLEEIALTAWHGESGGRMARASRVERYCTVSGLDEDYEGLRDTFSDERAGAIQLFATFFFRKVAGSDHSDPTFEFSHKSFSEYLLARRLIRCLEEIEVEMSRKHNSRYDPFKHLLEVFGPGQLTFDILQFIREGCHRLCINQDGTVDTAKTQEYAATLRDRLIPLLGTALEKRWPSETLTANDYVHWTSEALKDGRTPQARLEAWAINAEEGCLALIDAMNHATVEPILIDLIQPAEGDENNYASDAEQNLERLLYLKLNVAPFNESILRQCLRKINLNGAILDGVKLVGASLDGASLVGASLNGAILNDAILNGASLYAARLDRARLFGASLTGARLDDTSLVDASLVGASLDNARLDGARLDGGASLDGARLVNTSLVNTLLNHAILKNCTVDTRTIASSMYDEDWWRSKGAIIVKRS